MPVRNKDSYDLEAHIIRERYTHKNVQTCHNTLEVSEFFIKQKLKQKNEQQQL
jgi:hypothetical protein